MWFDGSISNGTVAGAAASSRAAQAAGGAEHGEADQEQEEHRGRGPCQKPSPASIVSMVCSAPPSRATTAWTASPGVTLATAAWASARVAIALAVERHEAVAVLTPAGLGGRARRAPRRRARRRATASSARPRTALRT